ncbi:uncharacterized protein ACBT57_013735 isoform 8-T8 [Dama dama]
MMIKLFSITLAAIPISVLTLSYQDISQKPGGNVINTEKEALSRNCLDAKEEKFSWKDILLIVLGAGLLIIIVLFYCCIKKYKKQGFQQRHSGYVVFCDSKTPQRPADQFLGTPDSVVAENEVLQNKLGELLNEIGNCYPYILLIRGRLNSNMPGGMHHYTLIGGKKNSML